MNNHKLVNYIKKELKRGVELNSLKKKLLSVGYSEKEINNALDHIKIKKKLISYKLLFFYFFVLLFLTFFSYHLFNYNNKVPIIETNETFINETNNVSINEELIIEKEESDLDLYSRALSQNDLTICEDIKDSNIKSSCLNFKNTPSNPDLNFYSRALAKNDATICYNILNRDIRNDCIRNFI